ncbi:gp53-like domain-containing protein [Salmonella enterica subsp. enterica]
MTSPHKHWFKDSNTGVLYQWGSAAAGNIQVNFPIAFPSAVTSVQLTLINSGGDVSSVNSATTTGFTQYAAHPTYWNAIGY